MKRFLSIAVLTVALAACIDTTGISPEAETHVHPLTNPNAAVILSEFADLQCPSCKAAHESLLPVILQKYGTQIRYEFHHFPILSLHHFAMDAAEGAECAADQGKFWEFVDMDFTNQADMSRANIQKWGESLVADTDLYNRCRTSHIKRKAIMAQYDAGKAAGVTGTPTFFVNGQRVPSTVEALSAAIDEALGTAGARL
jgi:protein-disulfide isomerase